MANSKKDPTEAIRLEASRYPGVDEGTACESYELSLAGAAGKGTTKKKPATKKATKKRAAR